MKLRRYLQGKPYRQLKVGPIMSLFHNVWIHFNCEQFGWDSIDDIFVPFPYVLKQYLDLQVLYAFYSILYFDNCYKATQYPLNLHVFSLCFEAINRTCYCWLFVCTFSSAFASLFSFASIQSSIQWSSDYPICLFFQLKCCYCFYS